MLRRKVFNDSAQMLIDGDEQCVVCAMAKVGGEHGHIRDGIGYTGSGPLYASHTEWIAAGLEVNLMALAFAAVVKPEELRL